MKSNWVIDIETICNSFILVAEHHDKPLQRIYVIDSSCNDFDHLIQFIEDCIKNKEWHISFNGLNFDSQVIQWIYDHRDLLSVLSGEGIAKNIYAYAQSVIDRSKNNQFLDYAPYKLKIKQIDLFKMNHWDNKAKMSSLKWIQYSMDWHNIEEMPHEHYKPILTNEERSNVIKYCINDVKSTKEIFNYSKEQIDLRKNLTTEYKLDLYSASEPRISKELFLHFLNEKLGWDKSYIKQLRTPRSYIVIADTILPYIKFKTQEFNDLLNNFKTKVITSTKDGFKFSVNYKGVTSDFGLGGLHGAISSGVYEAKPGWTIMSSDVVSYYPNLAIKNKFHPEHLPEKEFCELYEWIFEERKKIPKANPKNYVYKIVLNSTYGLTGDENSFLYDPKMTMQITINGQLSLCMLYEMICEEIPDAMPLMQNTDGLETMIPTQYISKYHEICARWEKLTQLTLEHDEYSKMIIRDVNSYIAINKSNKVKCKGAFEWEDLDKKKVAVFHKNKSFLIIPKAIYAYFVNGTLPEDYIAQNTNFLDYCGAVKAKGEWKVNQTCNDGGEIIKQELQKIVRYYVSKQGCKLIKCHSDGREIQVEAGKWMQTAVNRLDANTQLNVTDEMNIDYSYYLNEIYKEIQNLTDIKQKGAATQLSIF